ADRGDQRGLAAGLPRHGRGDREAYRRGARRRRPPLDRCGRSRRPVPGGSIPRRRRDARRADPRAGRRARRRRGHRALHPRARPQAFVAAGLRQEIRRLLARGYAPELPSLQSIGYREFVEVEQGRLTEDEALRRMQRDTVRYAKRQWTWFTREPDIEWIDVEAAGSPAR